MKRVFLLGLIALAALLCLPALADHSVLPVNGDMDETRTVDLMTALLCDRLGCGEEDIRGRWRYDACYYPAPCTYDIYEGPLWVISAEAAEPRDGTSFAEAIINAQTGEVLEWCESPGCNWFDHEDPFSGYPLIPRRDQLQPSEAIERALRLLAEAVPQADLAAWHHYKLWGFRGENGQSRYFVRLGRDGLSLAREGDPFAWNVCLDADTGTVIRQTDPVRFAARYAVTESGISYDEWYDREKALYAAEWGESKYWDYRQWAEFEEHCYGNPFWPEKHFGLPGDGECGYDEACAAAVSWLEKQGSASGPWTAVTSCFVTDDWRQMQYLMARGLTEGDHLWEIAFASGDHPEEMVWVWVDPKTGEAEKGPVG